MFYVIKNNYPAVFAVKAKVVLGFENWKLCNYSWSKKNQQTIKLD